MYGLVRYKLFLPSFFFRPSQHHQFDRIQPISSHRAIVIHFLPRNLQRPSRPIRDNRSDQNRTTAEPNADYDPAQVVEVGIVHHSAASRWML